MNQVTRACGWLFATVLMAGCTTIKTTTTARTATEQLLLSTATDHALQNPGFDRFAGRSVYLDGTYFDSYDSKYVLGTIRDALSRAGMRLENTVTNSDVILEARSGGLAIDESDTFFGVPSVGVPVPLAGTVSTPEVTFYKSQRQRATAKFALLAVQRDSGTHLYSTGPLDGQAFDTHVRFLFFAWKRTDVPEKQPTEAQMNKYQTWFPQYDHAPDTATNGPGKR